MFLNVKKIEIGLQVIRHELRKQCNLENENTLTFSLYSVSNDILNICVQTRVGKNHDFFE